MIQECPHCGNRGRLSAVLGRTRTMRCLKCGKGWKTGINGNVSYDNEIIIDFGFLVNKMTIQCGKRNVKLAPIHM